MSLAHFSRRLYSFFRFNKTARRGLKRPGLPSTEALESRQLLTITVSIQQGDLKIVGDADNNHVDVFDDPVTGGFIVETYQNWMDPDYPNSPKTTYQYAQGAFSRITFGGRDGDDRLFVNTSIRSVPVVAYGEGGQDFLHSGEADDMLFGGSGRDLLVGGAGNDRLYGEDDDDTLIGDLGLADTQKTGIDRLYGGEGNDILWGDGGTNTTAAGFGSLDYLFGEGGDDYLDGEVGDDILNGGEGTDTIHMHELDRVLPFDANDVIESDPDSGPIPTHYRRLANAAELLGAPTRGGEEFMYPDGTTRYRTYEKGIILSNPETGTFEIAGEIFIKWKQLGGFGNPIVGNPISTTRAIESVWEQPGRYQLFQTGSIFDREDKGCFVMHGEIHKRWFGNLTDASVLGLPASNEHDFRGSANGTVARRTVFDNGMIAWTPLRGAIPVMGDIYRVWTTLTNPGLPTGIQQRLRTANYQFFESARIYQHDGKDAFAVDGEFLVNLITYTNQGVNFGLPLEPPRVTRLRPLPADRVLRCEEGAIYYRNREYLAVYGAIYKEYARLGAEISSGPLGHPKTSEGAAANGGRFTRFDNGIILWTPQTGARAVYGEIFKTYESLGFERGTLGYPIATEADAGNGYRVSKFQNGMIFWSGPTGSIPVTGDFFTEYSNRGGENGFLLRPTSRVRKLSGLAGGNAMDFEGGTLTVRSIGGGGGTITKTVNLSFSFAQMKAALLSYTRAATVSAAALKEMRAFVASGSMPEHVRYLARQVTEFRIENTYFRGIRTPGGSLSQNDLAATLRTLVDKWFGGLDYPIAVANAGDRTPNAVERRFNYAFTEGVLFANAGPASHDVIQGALGSCYLLSALGALSDLNDSYITNMFIDNGDGTWTVRFFVDSAPMFVTVDRFLPVNSRGNLVFSGSGRPANLTVDTPLYYSIHPIWVHLVERAYAQLNESRKISQSGENAYNHFSDADSGIEGGNAGLVFEHVTNRPVETVILPFAINATNTNLIRRIDDLFGTRISKLGLDIMIARTQGVYKGITMGTYDVAASSLGYGLVPNHEYMVTAADDLRVLLRNPWGGSNSLVTVYWRDVAKNFAYWTKLG